MIARPTAKAIAHVLTMAFSPTIRLEVGRKKLLRLQNACRAMD
jgi:hypothetical protein